jgi:hypothetical protein
MGDVEELQALLLEAQRVSHVSIATRLAEDDAGVCLHAINSCMQAPLRPCRRIPHMQAGLM